MLSQVLYTYFTIGLFSSRKTYVVFHLAYKNKKSRLIMTIPLYPHSNFLTLEQNHEQSAAERNRTFFLFKNFHRLLVV